MIFITKDNIEASRQDIEGVLGYGIQEKGYEYLIYNLKNGIDNGEYLVSDLENDEDYLSAALNACYENALDALELINHK